MYTKESTGPSYPVIRLIKWFDPDRCSHVSFSYTIYAMRSFLGTSRFLQVILSLLSLTAAQSLICGTLGYHDESAITYYMGNFFYSGLTAFALCAEYCQEDTRCEAFRYSYWSDADTQYCEFFDTDL